MRQFLSRLFEGRLEVVLIFSFSFVAMLTVSLNALVISRVISNYLTFAESERVARDMDLADAFYTLKKDEIAAITHRLVLDPDVISNLSSASMGDEQALEVIDQQITNKVAVLALGGTHIIAVMDSEGRLIVGRVLTAEGELSPVITSGDWSGLPIVETARSTMSLQTGTEIIPQSFLADVGLAEQATIPLIDTPQAAEKPYDPREGTAGLAVTSVSPLIDKQGNLAGAVLAAHMFNNDFTIVDRIKEVAGVDTVTIFFGDMRVSTNVMTLEDERAVGTRVSQLVYDVVLAEGREYEGPAFVVNDAYITRYRPLKDHHGAVVGSLYVGALQSTFQALLDNFQRQVVVIALVCIALAAVIGVPIARFITRPIEDLAQATEQLAQGDMNVRVRVHGRSELGALGRSFNTMVMTLRNTQQELLHKEKLASVGQLSAGVAHEINNPGGTILLFSDVLLKESPEDDPRREDLEMIINEATRCKRIVADLLNFARQQEVLAQDTQINDLLDQVLESLIHQPNFEGINVRRNYSPSLPAIQADPEQLRQVFVNLLNNAAEAIEGDGTISLHTRAVDKKWVEIKVSDTGCGIPRENLRKMFTPFFTTKSFGQGTGLGLSIVYGIIKMHRGQIAVQSDVGSGTTFTVTLPIRLFFSPAPLGEESTTIVT